MAAYHFLFFGVLPALTVTAWYNWIRSGNPFSTGYSEGIDRFGFTEPIINGLFGLFFSTGKGLVWYAPVTLIAIYSWKHIYKKSESIFLASVIAVNFILTSMWWSWHGAESWGPRLIVPIIPLLIFPVGFIFSTEKINLKILRKIAYVFAVIGLFVQILGATISWHEFYRRVPYETWAQAMSRVGRDAPVEQLGRDNLDDIHYSIKMSPIIGQSWLLYAKFVGKNDLRDSCPWDGPVLSPDVDYNIDWWPIISLHKSVKSQIITFTLLSFFAILLFYKARSIVKFLAFV